MSTLSLHTCEAQKTRATINRIHMLFHFTATLSLLYYRASNIFYGDHYDKIIPFLSWWLMFIAELVIAFVWTLTQAFRWRPVARSVRPEVLAGNGSELPGVDVFICTADPKKEPTLGVMNTVLSAMALDYPPEKLAVYLSDDGGSAGTLFAVKETCSFAVSCWIPFCRKYGIRTRCPEAYFSSFGDDERLHWNDEFKEEEDSVKSAYEVFKKNVEKGSEIQDSAAVHDRPPYIEVIHDNKKKDGDIQTKMPLLVYVSREKRPSYPHWFKAGALNALVRVSGIISNAPYVLVLDCDMYCNDSSSARQAMCFHLDPNMESYPLAYVQFPQIFYNVSKNDIYDGQARSAYKTKYQGMDGLGGTVCAGTGYYLKKKALYGRPNRENELLVDAEKNFGRSDRFIASLKYNEKDMRGETKGIISEADLEEAKVLASCTFENDTKWGKEIGYSYDCLLESTFTGYLLHRKGWKSVYLYPKRPCFLGCTTIDMQDAMVQLMKWSSGLLQVGLSRFSPLGYGFFSRMSILQSFCYGYFTFYPLLSPALFIYGTVPQLCLLFGIPLFPSVSNPWFGVFGAVFFSSLGQHLYEVLSSGGSIRTWWNEQRIWIIRIVTASLFACLDVLSKRLRVAKVNFRLTNKVVNQEKLQKYELGRFDFEGAKMFMVPLVSLVMLNLFCFLGGVKRLMSDNNFGSMFTQVILSSYYLVLSYPILKELVSRRNK